MSPQTNYIYIYYIYTCIYSCVLLKCLKNPTSLSSFVEAPVTIKEEEQSLWISVSRYFNEIKILRMNPNKKTPETFLFFPSLPSSNIWKGVNNPPKFISCSWDSQEKHLYIMYSVHLRDLCGIDRNHHSCTFGTPTQSLNRLT